VANLGVLVKGLYI